MEKLNNILKNLYNSDSKIMLYVYIAIAVITVTLFLIIIISSFKNRNNRNTEIKPTIENDNIPDINILEEPTIPSSAPVTEESSILLNKNTPEFKPITKEEPKIYDKPLEVDPLDLTKPIKRVSTATDLLNEFLADESLSITPEELNKPLPIKEEVKENNLSKPLFSSVFLDKKANISLEPIKEKTEKLKIQLELTPINPIKIDSLMEKPALPEAKELILEPKILKPNESIKENKPKEIKPIKEELPKIIKKEPEIKNEKKTIEEPKKVEVPKKEETLLKEIKEDDSLDTKIDIFKHESLIQQNLVFDPFKPKTQEELMGAEPKEEKSNKTEKRTNSPVTLTVTDLKNKLSKLQSKASKEKEESFDDILRQIGLDELPDISPITNEASNLIRR